MLTAKEAREIVADLNAADEHELVEIMEDITKRSNNGYVHITYENKDFKPKTIEKLKELGYKINYGRHYNDEYTEINWK